MLLFRQAFSRCRVEMCARVNLVWHASGHQKAAGAGAGFGAGPEGRCTGGRAAGLGRGRMGLCAGRPHTALAGAVGPTPQAAGQAQDDSVSAPAHMAPAAWQPHGVHKAASTLEVRALPHLFIMRCPFERPTPPRGLRGVLVIARHLCTGGNSPGKCAQAPPLPAAARRL